MRKIVSWEGEEKVPNVIIEKGALTWDENQEIPVCWNFEHDIENLFGTARDLHRENDGSITAELNMFDATKKQKAVLSLLENSDVPATTFISDLIERQGEDGKRYIVAGRIRTINLVPPDRVGWH